MLDSKHVRAIVRITSTIMHGRLACGLLFDFRSRYDCRVVRKLVGWKHLAKLPPKSCSRPGCGAFWESESNIVALTQHERRRRGTSLQATARATHGSVRCSPTKSGRPRKVDLESASVAKGRHPQRARPRRSPRFGNSVRNRISRLIQQLPATLDTYKSLLVQVFLMP